MKDRIAKFLMVLVLSFGLMMTPTVEVEAQCPMCKMSAESNLKAGGTAGKGLNSGILYLLATPYLAVMTLGFLYYRNRRRQKDEEEEAFEQLLNDVNQVS